MPREKSGWPSTILKKQWDSIQTFWTRTSIWEMYWRKREFLTGDFLFLHKQTTETTKYRTHLNTSDSIGVCYLNGNVMWLGGPFKYQIFWTKNWLFPSCFQTTIWQLDTNLPFEFEFRWLMYIPKLKVISILKLYSGDLKSGRVWILNGGK